jgi:hypothetical protein
MKMNCNEMELKKLLDQQKQEITQTLIEEINKLKENQRELIRETIKSTIQEEFAKILNADKEKLFEKIDGLKDKVNANTLEELKEGLKEIGEGLEIIHNNILERQHNKAKIILDNIVDVFKENVALGQKLSMLEKDLANKFDIIYSVTKDTKDLVNRPRY